MKKRNGGMNVLGAVRETRGASNWLIGCSIAAVAGLALLVLVGFGAYRFATHGMSEAKGGMAKQFHSDYLKWKTEGKIPAAQKQVFAELDKISQSKDASFWTILLCFSSSESVMKDGKITDAEAKSLKDVATFVKAKPGAGMMDFTNFFQTHPDLQKAFQAMEKHPPQISGK